MAAPTEDSPPNPTILQALHQPVWDVIAKAKRVLISGCGGGYDFFAGIPIYLALRKAGVEVFLANLTFTRASSKSGFVDGNGNAPDWITPFCLKVEPEGWKRESEDYWPELFVAEWLQKEGVKDCFVYMILRSGVIDTQMSYKSIVERHNIDTIITADGGTDSLMTGNEEDLGTPTEDMTTICAVNLLENVPRKILMCIGFGVENVSALDKAGGFLGTFSLMGSMEEAKKLREVFNLALPENSIVVSSVLSAVEGNFGNHHSISRTAGSNLYISALMSQYWAFSLPHVARSVKYIDRLAHTVEAYEVRRIIASYTSARKRHAIRKPNPIPY